MNYFHSLMLSHVKERPTATAVADVTGAHTYAELAESATSWCKYLHNVGMGRGDRLVLVADTSFAAISVLVGCSMSGVIFTIISPEVPPGRREAIIDDLGAALVMLDANTVDMTESGHPVEMETVFNRFCVKIHASQKAKSQGAKISTPLTEDPVYIVFTSGSTGTPKGIVMSHRAVVSYLGGLIERMELRPDKRYATHSPLQFDFAIFDMGACLGSGATLVIPNRALLRKPEHLVDHLVKLKVTHFSGVPTIWKMILQSAPHAIAKLSGLERIVFAGEHFPVDNIRAIKNILPQVEFFNAYGQSETIGCSFHTLRPEDFDKPHIPVGTCHRDMEMILMDDTGAVITKPDVHGELYLKGSTLFSGYWKLPDQTKARLIQDPRNTSYVDPMFRSGDICYFDAEGLYYFVGRKDNQIKVNGNRVELEEIEARLNRYPGVANSCVVAINSHQGFILHAALVCNRPPNKEESDYESSLRSFLSANLSLYMLPKHYHFLDQIPINANGKNDRGQLVNLLGLKA